MTVPATKALNQAAGERWDVIVIGAGPAGAMAARGLVHQQLRTLVIDRKSFPREKVCGGCLSHRALSVMDHAGLSSQVAALGGVPLTQFQLKMGTATLEADLPEGLVVSRAVLDEMLIKAAISEGAEFLPQVTALVQPASQNNDRYTRRITCTMSDGQSVTLEASALVVADGLGHPSLRNCPEFSEDVRPASRLGLGTTLTQDIGGFDLGRVTMVAGPLGYIGATRFSDGKLHLAASVDATALRAYETPGELICQIYSAAHLPRLPEFTKADWRGTLPLTRQTNTVAKGRVFLVGDAAGYVEPFTGEGIAWALTTGWAVPHFVKRAICHNAELAERDWRSGFYELVRSRQTGCRVLTWVLRHPHLASTAIRMMKRIPPSPQLVINWLNRPLKRTKWDFA